MNFFKRQQSESFVFGTTLAEIAFVMFFLLIIISSHKEIGFESDIKDMQNAVSDVSEENARLKKTISTAKSDLVDQNTKLKAENYILSRENTKIKEDRKEVEERIWAEYQISQKEKWEVQEKLNRAQAEIDKFRKARGRPECLIDSRGRVQALYEAIIREEFLEVRIKENSRNAKWAKVDDPIPLDSAIFLEPVGKYYDKKEFNSRVKNVKEHADGENCVHYVDIYDRADSKKVYKDWWNTLQKKFYYFIKE